MNRLSRTRPPLRISFLLAWLAAMPLPAQTPEDFQLGLGLQKRGLHEEAVAAFARFLREKPDAALASEAWYRLGVSQAETGRKDEAARSFEKALRGEGFRYAAEARYRLAQLRRGGGLLAEAIREAEALLAAAPADHYLRAPALSLMGECQRDLGDDEKACASFLAAAAAAAPDQKDYRFFGFYEAGFAWSRMGQHARAAEAFASAKEAATTAEARSECLHLRGDCELRAGRVDDASKAFAECLSLRNGHEDDATMGLAFCALQRSDAREAEDLFGRLLKRHGSSPLVPRARLEIARIAYARRDYAGAREQIAALLKADGLAPEILKAAHEMDGLCALEIGKADEAVERLRVALGGATDEERPRISYALGEALAAKGSFEEACDAYRAVPETAGEDLFGDALYGACFCLHELGRHEESRKLAEELIAKLPGHRLAVEALFAVAENLYAERSYARAEEFYSRVPDGHALRGKAVFKLAWCAYLRGAIGEAARRFAAIARDGKAEQAEEALAMSALAWLEAGRGDDALRAADLYRARHASGVFLARTERVAARVLRARGDFDGAAERLAGAQRAASDPREAREDQLERAEIAYSKGDFTGARALYAPLAENEDECGARALDGLAWCAFELGEDDACEKAVARAMSRADAARLRPGLLELRCCLHQRRRAWDEAAEDAKEFLAEFPEHEKAKAMRYSLGLSLARGGRAEEAVPVLESLERDGGYERMDLVSYELAWARRRAKDEKGALESFARVAKATKDRELRGEAEFELGTAALEAGDLAGARRLLSSVQGSHRARALYRLAFSDFASKDAGRLPEAERELSAIREIGPEGELYGEATFLLGECRRGARDAKGAAAFYGELLRREPDHARAPLARLHLGEVDVAIGEPDEAVEHLELFLRRPAGGAAERILAHLALGRARQLRGEFARAVESFQEVTRACEGPEAAEAQYRIGECRLAERDEEGAVGAFVKLAILYAHEPWVPRGLLEAGAIYERLGQASKARKLYEEVEQRFPEAPERQEAARRIRRLGS
ncbi:MAG: hypothetical protein Fur0037_18670 [Planctomycetota bacterium]